MSTMQEFASGSTLFGGNAPYIEEQYERYLANPAEVPGEWRVYFDSLRDGAADVAHAPIVQSFIELARNRKVAGAMVDATTMHKQVLVLRLISKFRTLGMFHADLDPLQRQEKPYIADLDLANYGFTPADLDTDFDVGSFKSNTFKIEWPPRSGKQAEFPEIDRVAFFDVEEAARRINPAQAALVEQLRGRLTGK